jgi:ATP-dependent Clp protease adaptor protein ClpS
MSQSDIAVETRIKLKEPSRYKVVMLNDDFTPMDFVLAVLTQIFNFDDSTALALTYTIHNDGKGICGIYTREVAETKVAETMAAASQFGHPLKAIIEKT